MACSCVSGAITNRLLEWQLKMCLTVLFSALFYEILLYYFTGKQKKLTKNLNVFVKCKISASVNTEMKQLSGGVLMP